MVFTFKIESIMAEDMPFMNQFISVYNLNHLAENIFGFLDRSEDIFACLLVCKSWYQFNYLRKALREPLSEELDTFLNKPARYLFCLSAWVNEERWMKWLQYCRFGMTITDFRKVLTLFKDFLTSELGQSTENPYIYALRKGDLHFVTLLFKSPFDMSSPDPLGNKIIHDVFRHGKYEVVKTFIQLFGNITRLDLTVRNGKNSTPIHLACYNHDPRVTEWTIRTSVSLGINISHIKDDELYQPLHVLCQKGHLNVLKYLIETLGNSLDFTTQNRHGLSPICVAFNSYFWSERSDSKADYVQALMIRTLLAQGLVDRDILTSGSTRSVPIFHLLCRKAPFDTLKLFMDAIGDSLDFTKADETISNMTIIHEACCNYDERVPDFIIRTALSRGINIQMGAYEQRQPIHYLVETGHINVLNFLKAEGFALDVVDSRGETPLHVACFNNRVDIVKMLLDDPTIDFNRKSNNGTTPLHKACSGHSVEVVDLLLRNSKIKNIALDTYDNLWQKPIDLTMYAERDEPWALKLRKIRAMLEEYGEKYEGVVPADHI